MLLLVCIACNVEVMLAAVLGCSACMRVQCLYFVAMVLGLGAEVMLASVLGCLACGVFDLLLGCLACGEEFCFIFGAMGLGMGGGGDASIGARLLGMRRRVEFYP